MHDTLLSSGAPQLRTIVAMPHELITKLDDMKQRTCNKFGLCVVTISGRSVQHPYGFAQVVHVIVCATDVWFCPSQVRTEAEYAGGHVPGAVNVPLDSLSAAVKSGQLDQHRDSEVAVICQSGRRSAQATVKLTKVFGWPTVANVQGGTLAWISAGFDTAA